MMNAVLAGLVWRPAFAPTQIGALVAVLLVLAALVYFRGFRANPVRSAALLGLRIGLILAIGGLLLGPSRITNPVRRSMRPTLTILLDTSGSMATRDCSGQSRIAFASERWLSESFLTSLADRAEISLRSFDDDSRSFSTMTLKRMPEELAVGQATNLTRNVTSLVTQLGSSSQSASVLILSDGRDSNGTPTESAAAMARRHGIALHTVCLGANRDERDLSVNATPSQEYFIAGEPARIIATIQQNGYDHSEVEIVAKCGEESVSRRVRLGSGFSQAFELPITHKKAGMFEYQVSVSPLPGEATRSNNSIPAFVEVTDKRLNVLLLEGIPYWDSKFIAQSLRRDDRIRLTQLSMLFPGKIEAIWTRSDKIPTAAVPKTASEFAAYDLVILGRGMERMLDASSAGALRDYVSSMGGQVIFARGRAYDPRSPQSAPIATALAPLEPVIWGLGALGESLPELPDSVRLHPALSFCAENDSAKSIFSRLPRFGRVLNTERLKPAAGVLIAGRVRSGPGASGPPAPAVVAMNYGRGGTLTMLGEGYFRWALLPRSEKLLAGFSDAFWSNLVRWMALGAEFRPDEQVAFRLSSTSAKIGDSVRADVSFRVAGKAPEHPRLTVTDPTGTTRDVTLRPAAGRDNRLRAEIDAKLPGVYQVALEAPGCTPPAIVRKFKSIEEGSERLRTSADPVAMRSLAEGSGGVALDPGKPEDLLRALKVREESHAEPPKLEYVWDSGLILAGILLWAGVEWIGRRRGGLL